MRHGETNNNVLFKISKAAWVDHMTAEPELSAQGVEECKMVGTRMTEMGLNFDLMLTSAHKRAIQSLKNVRETYANSQSTPCEILTQIFEEHGVYDAQGNTYPGLSRSKVLELLPDLTISPDQA